MTVASGGTAAVSLSLLSNDARITGRIQDAGGQPITGVEGHVFAFNPGKGSWQETAIDTSDGSYSLNIAAGTWQVGYYVESSSYVNSPPAEGAVTVSAGQTVTKNFTLTRADYQISGQVKSPDGNALAGAWVFAQRAGSAGTPRLEAGIESSGDGTFTLSVPEGTYMVGAGAPPEWGYIEPAPQRVTVSGANPPAITLQFRRSDVVISGTVYLNGSPSPAFVEGWSGTGGWTHDEAGSDGRFSLNVVGNSTWHIRAVYEASGGAFYESAEETVTVGSASTTRNLTLVQSSQTIPDAVTRSFDAAQPQEITLEDGSQIQIPAGSLATSGMVTLMIAPKKADVPRTAAFRPTAFGYEISATDADGQPITGNFNKNVVIIFYYTDQQLAEADVSEDDLVPAYFSTTGNTWVTVPRYVMDKDNNQITMEINHFTTYGSGSSQQGTPAVVSDLSGSRSGNNLVLTWSAVTRDVNNNALTVDHYVIYRKANDPYFTPTASDILASNVTGTTYSDTGALGDPDNNYFYVVKAVSDVGKTSAISNRIGEFDFALTRGAYNTIVLPLSDSSLATADALGAATGATVVSRWVASTQSLDSRIVGIAGTNFSPQTGAGYFVYIPGSGSAVFSTVGGVPNAGSVQFSIERGTACKLNLISLPLNLSSLSTVDALAAAIGGVPVISEWRPATSALDSRIVGQVGTNFATRIGYPYWVCANTSGGGATWP